MKILGHKIMLNDDRDSDPGDYFRWFNLEEWQYYDQPDKPFQPVSREQFEERARKNRERAEKAEQELAEESSTPGRSRSLHIDALGGRHLGWVSTYNWDHEEGSVYIGICIPEDKFWGKGCGTEAVDLFLNYLFDTFDLNIIRAATWTGNHRMVRCAEKAGFRDPVIMPHRSPTSVRGEPLERIEFTLSREEWHQNKNKTD